MNWIEEVVQQHKDFESPLSFWRWGAIAAISAVVKDNVWINQQMYNLYPNIYVMFHADSGLKKGPPVNMAKRLVKMVNNTKIISGRSSIQGILKDLGSQTAHTLPGGKVVIPKATCFICSSEFSSSIVEDKVATTILTDLYDRSYNVGDWRSLLKMETFDLKDPTITMLTATNQAHSDDFFTKKDIIGGYYARTFIIHETVENRSNSLQVPLESPIDYQGDAEYLKKLANLTGQFAPTGSLTQTDHCARPLMNNHTGKEEYFSDAGLIYEEWYKGFKENLKTTPKEITGTLNRFGTSVMKVAMLLSLARAPELILTSTAMEEAIFICEKLLGDIRTVTINTKSGELGKSERKVILLQELLSRDNHMISNAQLLKKFWQQGSSSEWAESCTDFQDAGMIKIETIGNQVVHRMPDSVVEKMQEFFGGKLR